MSAITKKPKVGSEEEEISNAHYAQTAWRSKMSLIYSLERSQVVE